MFRFTRKPSSGSYNQYLAKIKHLVQSGYVEFVLDVFSDITAYCDLWGVCTVHWVRVYCILYTVYPHTGHSTHALQVTIYSYITDVLQNPGGRRNFPHLSRPALRPNQPPVYNGYQFFPGGKVRPERDADPSPPSSAEVKNRLQLYL